MKKIIAVLAVCPFMFAVTHILSEACRAHVAGIAEADPHFPGCFGHYLLLFESDMFSVIPYFILGMGVTFILESFVDFLIEKHGCEEKEGNRKDRR